MMITLPIFVPVVRQLGFSDVWFAVIYLINIEIAGISPPFGLSLFVMKGVALKAPRWATSIGGPALHRVQPDRDDPDPIFPEIALWLPKMTGSR